ncbi:MAG TPA: CGNR zinc finger domain-containing protein [Actinomycetota bacterium]|jgi:predicted RNA-binding Zn ribbon-like protein|nr:CGNR zinc finger domain-containing protein [Actinomycetota bacterium]
MANYEVEGAEVAADLVNSLGSHTGNEYLPNAETLRALLATHGFTQVPVSEQDVEEARSLRPRLRRVFEARDDDTAIEVINELLTEAAPIPQLTRETDDGWRFEFTVPGESTIRWLIALTATGLAAVMSEFGRDRLGVCSADNCRDVFVDVSRNRSRRYCSATCSTRTNVAAFRARRHG